MTGSSTSKTDPVKDITMMSRAGKSTVNQYLAFSKQKNMQEAQEEPAKLSPEELIGNLLAKVENSNAD